MFVCLEKCTILFVQNILLNICHASQLMCAVCKHKGQLGVLIQLPCLLN